MDTAVGYKDKTVEYTFVVFFFEVDRSLKY